MSELESSARTPAERAPIDAYFSRLMARLSKTSDHDLVRLFADLSHALTSQHSCIDLRDYDDPDSLRARISALAVVGDGSEPTPIVLEGHRLFLSRYYQFEVNIAERLAKLNRPLENVDEARIETTLAHHFPDASRQKLAALQALTRGLTIVAGGPGTGKTTTVAGILKSLVDQGEGLSIALAAPTGKAAMRLQASLGDLDGLPEVKTLHRLLGYRPGTGEYRHGAHHRLTADLVIIDEVSMIDLAMMNRLLGALHDEARLILLGDPGQLPSVEAGNLLADICKYGFPLSETGAALAARFAGLDESPQPTWHKLQDSLCELVDSHRFSAERGIGRLAAALRRGEAVQIANDDEVDVQAIGTLTETALIDIYRHYIDSIECDDDDETLATLFDRVRVLVPMREGDYGVTALNITMEDALRRRGLIGNSPFYHGRPVLVTRNDYNLRLYNGDVGICIVREGDEPRVVFHGSAERREFLASRLPGHETCFAMTVHKSQGSEFDHVALALPAPATSSQAQLLTREMFYTAITRARHRLSVYFDDESLALSLEQHTVRHSGLGERLLLASPAADEPPTAA